MNAYDARADAIDTLVNKCLVDRHGLLRSAINADTMQPFNPHFFDNKEYLQYPGQNWDDHGDLIHYENVGMSSGAYLAAMSLKHKATGCEKALVAAQRTFKGIVWLYDLSQQVEPGFYCKCYGGVLSHEISSDQYIYTFAGLDEYYPFAEKEEQTLIEKMIEEMVRFWMRKNYSYPYFGKPLNWPIERFPAFAWLAYHYSGKKEFLDEFQRLLEHPATQNKIPFGPGSWDELVRFFHDHEPRYDFEQNSTKRFIAGHGESSASGWLSLFPLFKYDAPAHDLWLKKAEDMVARDRHYIEEDGTVGGCYLLDTATGELSAVTQMLNDGSDTEVGWKYFRLVSGYRSGMWSTMFARALVSMNRYLDEDLLPIAADILSKHKTEDLLWFRDPDGHQFPDDMKWMARTWSSDAVTNWLWGYHEATVDHGVGWIK